jgi:malonyl-CoA/methylmalonyl-CoA synthetase
MNLYQILRDRFGGHPDRIFLQPNDGAPVTYAEIDRMSAHYAAALLASGVASGDRVVVQVDKCPGAVALYLACLRVGAVYVPLNVAYTSAEVAYFLTDARPAVCVGRPKPQGGLTGVAAALDIAEALTLAPGATGSLDRRAAATEPANEVLDREPDELAAILYTSGTTGRSKGAMLTHANLSSNALTLHELWGWRDGDVLLHALPIFHVHGLFVALNCAMLNASTVLFQDRFDVMAVRTALRKATMMMGVPTFYTRLLEQPDFNRADCFGMRLFISGSAPLRASTFDEFAERTGRRILERYGMTETGMISSNPLEGERRAGTVGYALPGVEVRVTGDHGDVLAPGQVGVVEVRGDGVFAGYWGMPDRAAADFRDDGFFITGDLGSLAPDGRLTLVGRAKDLIISGGYNIYPKEIESCLNALPGVVESAVIGVPHRDFGEAVIAVIVTEGTSAPDQEKIRAGLDGKLAPFKQPKKYFLTESLPRNAMGKIQKNVLRERFASALED